ncbi:MAG: apolipoprotein N-acyltransferase [Spirochaetes bacterium]|nr:apolipoprotein N-acyltransferase [Spirochaetota bacterium]
MTEVLIELFLLSVGGLLFALSFPSFISEWGWFPLAFFALIPVFVVIHRSTWPRIFFYGIFFGFVSYAIFNFWLAKFSPLTLFIVPPIYSFYFLLVFPMLKAADTAFPKYGYILQSIIWVAYEYLRTKGFLGYSYGNLGYSQYLFTPIIQIASITGVWGVSLLIVYPSALLGNAFKDGFKEGFNSGIVRFKKNMKYLLVPALVYAGIFASVLLYGFIGKVDYSASKSWKTALIQQNVDPWKGGTKPYERSLNILLKLSREAVLQNPDIVIWSETSFVPGIDWHTRYRTDIDKYLLVKRLVDFLKDQKQPYVIGNDDGQLEKNEDGKEVRVDYNATVLYEKGKIIDTYRKLHLVPFTEYFPFKKTLPRIYEWLVNADTHFWKRGTKYTVFDAAGVKFSTPICFEDTFGNLIRNFVRKGADVIVNMTNDSWSYSVAAEIQHMSMAVFRAVENRRTVIRSTNGGITCSIDPNGKILDLLKPFKEGFLVSSVPVYKDKTTLYTRWGDWFAMLMVFLAITGIIVSLVRLFVKKN